MYHNTPTRLTSLGLLLASFPGAHAGAINPALFGNTETGRGEYARVMNAVGNPAGLNAMGFTVSVYDQISSRAFDVKYPEIQWSKFIPSASIESVSPGAVSAIARVRDWRGKGAFRAVIGKDIPQVGISIAPITVPLEVGAVSASVDREDLRRVAFGFEGMNLLTEKGAAMRLAYERHREDVFFFGYSPLGFDGYINTATVPATTAATKTAGGTTWAVATAQEIVNDVITAVSTIITNTAGIFRPNRIVLPIAQLLRAGSLNYSLTGGTPTGESVLVYLKRTLPELTGGPVEFAELRYLTGAGAGATNRMIVETVQTDTFYMPDAIPFDMLPPQDVQFATHLFAEYKFGGLLRPWPTSAVFVDGV